MGVRKNTEFIKEKLKNMKLITFILCLIAITEYGYSINADTVLFKDGELLTSTIKETKIYVPRDVLFLEGALGEYMSLSVNYQKQVLQLSDKQRLFLNAGFSVNGIVEPDSYSFPISLKYVYGNTNALEFGLGTMLHFQQYRYKTKTMSDEDLKLTASLSYRFQKKYVNTKGETDTDFFTIGIKTIYQVNSIAIFNQHFITALNLNINITTIF